MEWTFTVSLAGILDTLLGAFFVLCFVVWLATRKG